MSMDRGNPNKKIGRMMMIWNEIKTRNDVEKLNDMFDNFHDSYLKEMSFSSGCFIDEKLKMHEINNPTARFLFQRAWRNPAVIEIQFENVIQVNIKPNSKNEFSDIMIAHLYLEDNVYFWSARDYEFKEDGKDNYTWIASRGVKWRINNNCLGEKTIYLSEI